MPSHRYRVVVPGEPPRYFDLLESAIGYARVRGEMSHIVGIEIQQRIIGAWETLVNEDREPIWFGGDPR
jgi:hypothetical protein